MARDRRQSEDVRLAVVTGLLSAKRRADGVEHHILAVNKFGRTASGKKNNPDRKKRGRMEARALCESGLSRPNLCKSMRNQSCV